MPKIRVVIVDDESPARRKVRRFLALEDDFEIVGEAGTGLEAVRVIEQEKPVLVFLDVQTKFIRANRSQIVNVKSIKELHPWFHGEYRIILQDGTEISWSRRYLARNSNMFLKLG